METMKTLEGSIETFPVPDVFRLLARGRVTGGLRLVRESGDAVVFFREGEVYYAFSSLTREFLGQRLVSAKLITQGQLLRILDEQKRSGGRRIGDILIEKGILSKELLDTFLREQIQDTIFNVLQWDAGTFSFEVGETAAQEVGLSVSVENLIMECSRRIEEWEVIRRKIPSLDIVVRMAPAPPQGSVEINIKPEEWTLLVLADGTRTVGDIAAASERSEFEACKIIYGLVTAGLLDVASGPLPAVAASIPPRAAQRAVVEEPAGQAASPAAMAVPSVEETEVPVEEPRAGTPVEEEAEEISVALDALEAFEARASVDTHTETAERSDATSEPVPATAAVTGEDDRARFDGNGSAEVKAGVVPARKKTGDPTITKELLQRLIAGVRNL